ncbi:MAG: hypothetical protein PHE25_04525, partial [Candidatus Gracilibacteria bacterium]|nr:hypothetical protein [Candidatus Gracilibacteria bacterium]
IKNNFLKLFLPQFIFYVVIYFLIYYSILSSSLFFDTKNILSYGNYVLISAFSFLILAYLFLQIGFILGLYKTIIDIDNGKEVDLKSNYKYGFLNIFESFKTYYYIFIYVYGIPALIFIIAGIYFIYIQMGNIVIGGFQNQMWNFIWVGIMLFLGFMIYIIYRSNKSIFAILSAVSEDDFSKENFKKSVSLTNGNWWRIFGNFLLVGIIFSLFSGIISSITPSDSFGIGDITKLTNIQNGISKEDVLSLFENFKNGFMSLNSIIGLIISKIIEIFSILFVSVFTYIFYKRLQEEQSNNIEKNFN